MANKRVYFTLSETLNRILNWGFVFILAFFLAPKEYGMISVLISIESILAAILLGGFDRAAMRFISDASQKVAKMNILKLWLYLAIPISIVILLSIYFTHWNERYYINNSILLVFITAIISLTLSRIIAAISRAEQDLPTFIIAKIISPIMKILLFTSMVYYENSIAKSYFMAVSIGFLPAVLLPLFRYLKHAKKSTASTINNKSIYAYALPFLPHSIAGIILASIDRIMVNDMMGVYEAGIYSFSYMIGSALSFVYAITAVTYERDLFANSDNKGTINYLQNTYFYLLNNLGFIAIIAVYILYYILKSMQMEYATDEAIVISVLVMLSYILNIHYLKSSYFLSVEKKTSSIASITITTMIFNVACNYLLIPKYGVAGAAYATLFTYIILSILMTLTAKYKTDYDIFNKTQLFYSILSLLAISLLIYNPIAVLILSIAVALITLPKTINGIKIIFLFHSI